jgi:hypothetical protein
MPSQNQLRVALKRYKAVSIAACAVATGILFFLASDESPDFIALNVLHGKAIDGFLRETLAAFTDEHKQVQNGISVRASDSLNGTDGNSLNEQAENTGDLLGWYVGSFEALWPVAVGLVALTALEALITLPVAAKLFALGSTVMAGHGACLSCEASR